jgi:hypothetical protein
MSFQCSDLDDALRSEELPSDAKDHAETCAQCRERLEMWSAIRNAAPELHREWESPALWPRIQAELQGSSKHRGALRWQYALAAAAAVLLAIALYLPWSAVDSTDVAHDSPFLNAESLREVEQAENAYVRAIEKLSAAAGTTLEESPTPLAALYREKLALLDSAIADLKAGVDANGYNVYLQTQLASLYREKQKTLEEWLENAKDN